MEIDLKIILSMIASVFGAYFWLYNNTKTNLQQSLYRKSKISLLEAYTFEEKYKTKLQSFITWLDNIYDNSTFIQNYSRHVTIALLYSFIVFVVFWVLGAKGEIGTVEILREVTTSIKLKALAFFIIYTLFFYFLYNNFSNLIEFIIKKFPKNLQKNNIVSFLILILTTLVVFILGLLIIGVPIGKGAGIEGFILILLGMIIIKEIERASIIKNILNRNLIISGLITTPIFTFQYLSNSIDIYIIGLFLILLPLINSLFDYLSLKVSKYMAEQIMKDNFILSLLLHLLADLMIAIILLLSLALFLHFSVLGLNMFINEPIPMKEMLVATWNDPFSLKNGWITFMLLSTLVPTVVHLLLALGALFVAIMPSKQSLENLKKYNKGQEALLESAAHYFTRIAFAQTFFSFVVLVLISLPFWYGKL